MHDAALCCPAKCCRTCRGESLAARRGTISSSRAYGKPPTFSTTDTTQLKRAIDMTDDELVQIITQAKLTVVK
jgi:hypothetical protein